MLAESDRLLRNLLLGWQYALGLAQLQVDGVAVGAFRDPLDDAAHHLALVLEDILEHLVLLRVPQPLEHHLLADLGGEPREIVGWERDVDHVAQRRIPELAGLLQADLGRRVRDGIHHPAPAEDRDLRGIRVDMHPNALRRIEGAPVCGGQRRLHQGQQRLLGDPLFFLDLVERLEEIRLEH